MSLRKSQGRGGVTDAVNEVRTQSRRFGRADRSGDAPGSRQRPGSVSGVVRDSAGVPQIGAEVQLLRPDLSVVASVYTNSKGRFTIASVLPGRYALKAMGASFLPSLRENVACSQRRAVVNLTLNTLYEVMQWLPAEPRSQFHAKDDWEWTLRSAANRPLLRWLEDGPLVVVSDGTGAAPKLKARLMATGQAGTFGESGERFSASVEDTPSQQPRIAGAGRFCSRHRRGHGIDAWLPPGPGICRIGSVVGHASHSSRD